MTDNIMVKIKKEQLSIIQINVGDRCNQTCTHCHIGASPSGRKNMDYKTAKRSHGEAFAAGCQADRVYRRDA